MYFVALLCVVSVYSLTTTTVYDCDINPDAWEVDQDVHNMKFEYKNKCYKDDRYVKIEGKDLVEYEPNGDKSKNEISGFSGEGEWISDGNAYDGINAEVQTFRAWGYKVGSDKVNVNITMQTVFFEQAGTVTVNGDFKQSVTETELKFTLSVINWPWESTENNVTFQLKIETKNLVDKEKDDANKENKDKYKSVTVGNVVDIDLPLKYICGDETTGSLRDVVPQIEEDGSGTKLTLFLTFAYCDQTQFIYDPFLNAAGDADGSSQAIMVANMNVLINLMVLCVSVTYFTVSREEKCTL